jgi:hypothetical protein
MRIAPKLHKSQFDTVRLLLLKVSALVEQSARRVLVRLPTSFPHAGTLVALARALGADGTPGSTSTPKVA